MLGRQGRKIAIWTGIVLLLSWAALDFLMAWGTDQTRLVFWLQTLSGNWSPVPRPAWASNLEYSGSAVVGVVINYGPWVAIFGYIWNALKVDRRRRMKLGEALQAYDVAVRGEIIRSLAEKPPTSLEDVAARIDAGLAEGRKQAIPIIKAVWGEEAVTAWDAAQGQQLGGS